jgi:hypothetical protein
MCPQYVHCTIQDLATLLLLYSINVACALVWAVFFGGNEPWCSRVVAEVRFPSLRMAHSFFPMEGLFKAFAQVSFALTSISHSL